MRWFMYFLILCLFNYGKAADYKAAVLEFYPLQKSTENDTIAANLQQYREMADRNHGVDIIIFPEYGLTGLEALVNPQPYSIEVSDDSHFIKELSAMAFERQVFMIVNLLEKESKDGTNYYYNTNLVFNRNGSIILKYRKINLFKEGKLTQGSENQSTTFKTDFGVTFGIFTGSDILFNTPSRTLEAEVTDVVFQTALASQTPFFASLSIQHGYSVSNGVNLLAASVSKPKNGRGGSGIYTGYGKIAETYIGDSASIKMISHTVEKITTRISKSACSSLQQYRLPDENPNKTNVGDYNTETLFDASKYQFQNIDLTQNFTKTEVCDQEFCCTFELVVNTSQTTTDFYKVMAFDGAQSFDNEESHVRICSLVACESESTNTCGARVEISTQFIRMTVRGNLPVDNTSYYAPVTLNNLLLPMSNVFYCNVKNGTNTFVQMETTEQDRVLSFGLFGKTDVPVLKRKFGDDSGNGAIISLRSSLFLIIFAFVTKVLL